MYVVHFSWLFDIIYIGDIIILIHDLSTNITKATAPTFPRESCVRRFGQEYCILKLLHQNAKKQKKEKTQGKGFPESEV